MRVAIIGAGWIAAEHAAILRRLDGVVLADDGLYTPQLEQALATLGIPPLPQYAIQPPSTSRLTPDT